ncbi:sugar phosphate isomerase/epimerase [Bacillus sp. REN3]|uniref:sugar phosphate isomerase/epimerase family protein n=1 Tax=Bacillus sp. REN3 TaxID=2802440 RepID=UPI001AED827A|nr:sugar phosphate isomerase/epimerase [Bacillus sp. REN3]
MKFGVSSYSLYQAMQQGQMSFLEAIDWVKGIGGEHFEVVPLGFDLLENASLVKEIRKKAEDEGIELSNYAIGADFLKDDPDEVQLEIERVKKHVDIAHELGVKFMRHDVASRPPAEATIVNFIDDLPVLAEACREIADHARSYGIVTSVENHGFYVQSSDRVQLLVHKVGRPNFRTTLDVGNFLCADEDPVSAVKNNISLASMVHVKDFYHRPDDRDPGEGWFRTTAGNFLRGAITGQGDLDLRQILKIIKKSGYDGYLSLEFEGLEECRFGTRVGFENLRRIWQEV